jgi:parvulin-like peptidyl-prolyl isomerase
MVMTRNVGMCAALAALVTLAGCDPAARVGPDVLATAAGHQLSVEEAAQLLSGQNELPAQAEVVEALADLWIDYTLLATAAARDASLAEVDISPLIRLQEEQEVVFRLREQVIEVDTTVTDEELLAAFERDAPGVAVRARHILFTYPDGATPMERDSVRSLAATVRERIRGGEDFAVLAREYSQDPGSAAQGGDLGFFQRGQMVASFDSAAFSLPTGEVSEPVDSPFGLHVIRVEERQVPDFDEVRDQFRQQYIGSRVQAAESEYVNSIQGPANLQVQEGAAAVVRELAARPQTNLRGRAASRALVTFEGGSYTAGDFQEWVQGQSPAFRSQFQGAQAEQLDGLLESLSLGRVLVAEARRRGVELSATEREELTDEARSRLAAATAGMGFAGIQADEGETLHQAIHQRVLLTLEEMLRGERDVVPLGAIAYSLRRGERTEVYEAAVQRTVLRLSELRSSGAGTIPPGLQLPGLEPGQPLPVPNTP